MKVSRDPTIRKLLAPMVDREVDLRGPDFRVDRERILARMAQATRKPPERSRPRPRSLARAFFAAAAVFALLAGARLWAQRSRPSLQIVSSHGGVTQLRDSARARVEAAPAAGAIIAAEGELSTAIDSSARLRTPDGIELELGAQTSVALGRLQPRASGTSQVTLLVGTLRCNVPHDAKGHAFQVVTPEVTVVDLGTVFTVSLDGTGRAAGVSVEEGEVMVEGAQGRVRVHAPDTWSSSNDSAGSREATESDRGDPVAPSSTSAPAAPVPSGPQEIRSSGKATQPPAPTLDQEGQLLRQGLAAERQGRSSDAAAAFTQLLQKYPRSPLAPVARDALARVEAGQRQ
jgi:hypothetical protein